MGALTGAMQPVRKTHPEYVCQGPLPSPLATRVLCESCMRPLLGLEGLGVSMVCSYIIMSSLFPLTGRTVRGTCSIAAANSPQAAPHLFQVCLAGTRLLIVLKSASFSFCFLQTILIYDICLPCFLHRALLPKVLEHVELASSSAGPAYECKGNPVRFFRRDSGQCYIYSLCVRATLAAAL